MTDPRNRADEVLGMIEMHADRFRSLPDVPGMQIHCLFAGLYRETTARWLNAIHKVDEPLFAYLVVRRFYDIYESSVPDHLLQEDSAPPIPWRAYHALARRLKMTSPISAHLLLISFGARAHIYHDLADAIEAAASDYQAFTGRRPDFAKERATITGAIARDAFYNAALDYVEWHRSRQSGWRRFVLSAYATSLRVLRPIWLGNIERWRSRAWSTAISSVNSSRHQTPAPARAERA